MVKEKLFSFKNLLIFFIIVISFISLMPLYWMFLNSLQPNVLTVKIPPNFILREVFLGNYQHLLERTQIVNWVKNSMSVSLIRMVLTVYICTLAGFPLAKRKFPGRTILFWSVIIALTIPRQALLLPLFIMMRDLSLFNTHIALILPNIAWPFGVFLMKQFIQTIPDEIFDAAEIDGCKDFRLFHQIVIPIVKPALGALAIFSFTNIWNDYMWQLLIIRSNSLKPLPLGIAGLADEHVANYGLQMAAACIGAIPLLLIFFLFQKYFTRGITLGAVKG